MVKSHWAPSGNVRPASGDVRGPATLAELAAQARTAADLGYRTAWASQALGWDALTSLAAVGALVPDIGLGTAVVPTPQRHRFRTPRALRRYGRTLSVRFGFVGLLRDGVRLGAGR